jgi:hypothetical protein
MKRHWVKLWVNEWLDGTTRFQMTGAQRAFWTDLLAMAGRSRFPGLVCSGRDGDSYVGYPLTTFAALDPGAELDIKATFELFVATGKIAVEVTAEKPVKLYKVTITNWSKYQSEYQRQKPYQETYRQKSRKLSKKLTPELSPELTANYLLEGEVRSESEKEKQNKPTQAPNPGASEPLPDWLPVEPWNAFLEMRKKKRTALTAYAVKLAILNLEKLRAAGNDPKDVLNQSTMNGYQGLFEVRVNFAPAREADRNRDAGAGKFDPHRPVKEQTAEEKAELEEMQIEQSRWDQLEKGTLQVNAGTVAWARAKHDRLKRITKLPAQDPRPRWLSNFLGRTSVEKAEQVVGV